MLSMLLALAVQSPDDAVAARLAATTSLYDELCLRTFPDDAALDAEMAKRGARQLTPAEVKITLNDDPGRGWSIELAGATALVILETPPYHACSVRWPMPADLGDLSQYRALAKAYTAGKPGFAPMDPMDVDMGELHIAAIGEQRTLPNGGGESLLVIAQQVRDPKRRANGETGTMLRFVHQISSPGAH